jgi:hypothetical protein
VRWIEPRGGEYEYEYEYENENEGEASTSTKRLFAGWVWTAGVPPAPPDAEGVGGIFTTSCGVA